MIESEPDDFEIFGTYVASELRSRSALSRDLLKNKILQAILDVPNDTFQPNSSFDSNDADPANISNVYTVLHSQPTTGYQE